MTAFYENDDDSQLTTLFALFDRDGNGRITASELQAVMGRVAGERVSNEEVEAMIKEADTNGDGVLDPSEFIAIMKKHK